MRCAIVIPARMGSTRFPGKPLCDLHGKPMVRWVVEASMASGTADRVLVATPDEEIVSACGRFGAEAVLTRNDHETGTDRLAEVASMLDADVIVNVQGDEPLIRPASIAACARPLLDNPALQMGSVYCSAAEEELDNPAVVKVVTDLEGFALYFSRWPIPYPRNPRSQPVKKHLGLYAYRRTALLAFATWPMSPLERAESLEQLRFMQHGVRIKMSSAEGSELAVDTPEQAEVVRRILASRR
ncbi:MAG: 3-deoxy-manno-octulosonate cytidylyltransferase [Fimbriimonas ginsengisoli]|uniref:3-deoxy-manno-octulosonate cytidylyltransferase n=1 Tax=Fimbriimonas ginsengisoli TaxID=1005039 RepID=A0A931LWF3_FIMGI|nr:3-deoxy-manno-octulosonate cytidylyltransferase [Fimbriimonas ginsengisoli]MBI3721271.1 3-deoxy-manno-octulosonate cytidylyltransferase [Fimbriimonas ginsengisoli]